MMMSAQPTLQRREAVAAILAQRGDALVVTGLGSPTWDASAVGDDPRNFYLWGAMGGAAMVGLGLALAQPQRRVLVLTGDGEMLMGTGSLATIGVQRPSNLAVVVLDNEHYGETGMQATHTGAGVDLAAIAKASLFAEAMTVRTETELQTCIAKLYRAQGPVFATVKISTNKVPMVLPLRDGTHIKNRFREAVLGAKAFE
jgi:thiamine pyrophosphate-dependent acetolactate synthase large subunit-like protein